MKININTTNFVPLASLCENMSISRGEVISRKRDYYIFTAVEGEVEMVVGAIPSTAPAPGTVLHDWVLTVDLPEFSLEILQVAGQIAAVIPVGSIVDMGVGAEIEGAMGGPTRLRLEVLQFNPMGGIYTFQFVDLVVNGIPVGMSSGEAPMWNYVFEDIIAVDVVSSGLESSLVDYHLNADWYRDTQEGIEVPRVGFANVFVRGIGVIENTSLLPNSII